MGRGILDEFELKCGLLSLCTFLFFYKKFIQTFLFTDQVSKPSNSKSYSELGYPVVKPWQHELNWNWQPQYHNNSAHGNYNSVSIFDLFFS